MSDDPDLAQYLRPVMLSVTGHVPAREPAEPSVRRAGAPASAPGIGFATFHAMASARGEGLHPRLVEAMLKDEARAAIRGEKRSTPDSVRGKAEVAQREVGQRELGLSAAAPVTGSSRKAEIIEVDFVRKHVIMCR